MSEKILLLLIIKVFATKGVLLDGHCPTVPPTHYLPNNRTGKFYNDNFVVRNVPFETGHPSQLFRERNHNLKAKFSYNRNEDNFYFILFYDLKDTLNRYVRSNADVYPNDPEVLNMKMESEVCKEYEEGYAPKPFSCHNTSVDEVRLWFEGQFIFIWSCTDKSTYQHDEAVIIFGPEDIYSDNPEDFDAAIKNLKTTSQSFLHEPLMEKIEWKYLNRSDKYDPMDCPVEKNKDASLLPFMIGGVWIIVILLIVGIFVGCYKCSDG